MGKPSIRESFGGFTRGFNRAVQAVSFIETFSLKTGVKKFGSKGTAAAMKEMGQLHNRGSFKPIRWSEMSPGERKKAMESLIFLTEKRDGTIKARTCANGGTQRVHCDKEDSASPTASIESIMLTSLIEAVESRDVATVDIPNAFIQTVVGRDKDGDRIVVKVRGKLVDMLIELDPTYADCVETTKDGKKVLCLEVKRAIYGMLQSALLFYRKLRADLEKEGFTVNPHDACTANKMIAGSQCTVVWHVDDLKEHSFAQNCSLKKAETVFGERALNAAFKEMRQMHDRMCFEPISKDSMTALECRCSCSRLGGNGRKSMPPWSSSSLAIP